MQAQLRPGSTVAGVREHAFHRVSVVRVVGMEHPLRVIPAHHGKIHVGINNVRSEHLTLKLERFVHVPHKKIDCQRLQ